VEKVIHDVRSGIELYCANQAKEGSASDASAGGE
jgi:hypothetical protein